MTIRTLYLIGLPGSGKSTLMRNLAALYDVEGYEMRERPIPHMAWLDRTGEETGHVELGRIRESFSGTDALAMNINPKAVAFVQSPPEADWLLAEGDRLANWKFLEACPRLTIVLVKVPPELARERSIARAQGLGVEPQGETWWKGRRTRIANLTEEYECFPVDGTLSPVDVARQVRDLMGALV